MLILVFFGSCQKLRKIVKSISPPPHVDKLWVHLVEVIFWGVGALIAIHLAQLSLLGSNQVTPQMSKS